MANRVEFERFPWVCVATWVCVRDAALRRQYLETLHIPKSQDAAPRFNKILKRVSARGCSVINSYPNYSGMQRLESRRNSILTFVQQPSYSLGTLKSVIESHASSALLLGKLLGILPKATTLDLHLGTLP